MSFTWAQSFLISRLISFFEEPETSQTRNIGLGLVVSAALIYTGIAVRPFPSDLRDVTKEMQVSTVLYMHQLYRKTTMLRGV